MARKINIYGPSGSGKTKFIIDNAFSGLGFFVKAKSIFSYQFAVSLLPLPLFQGTVEMYFKMFAVRHYEIEEKFDELRDLLGIDVEKVLEREYATLSAGEKRRLDIFRCVLMSRFVVIDEPFSNSSNEYSSKILEFLNCNCECVVFLNHSYLESFHNIQIEDLAQLEKIFDIQPNFLKVC